MKKYIVAFASVTYANKARALLNKYRIASEIRRTPKNVAGGCGYSVIAAAPAEKITRILEEGSVPYKTISEI